jgi:hypothetical protein
VEVEDLPGEVEDLPYNSDRESNTDEENTDEEKIKADTDKRNTDERYRNSNTDERSIKKKPDGQGDTGYMQKKKYREWLSTHPVFLAISLIAAFITTYVFIAPILFPTEQPTFAFVLVAKDRNTGQPISNAVVRLEVGKRPAITEQADSGGYIRFVLPEADQAKTGKVVATAPGYEDHTQDVDIVDHAEPIEIMLRPTAPPAPPDTQ